MQLDRPFEQVDTGLQLARLSGLLVGDALQGGPAEGQNQLGAGLVRHVLVFGQHGGGGEYVQGEGAAGLLRFKRSGGHFLSHQAAGGAVEAVRH
ncbi:hypothetical protein D3C77_654510 [compost metagenome]